MDRRERFVLSVVSGWIWLSQVGCGLGLTTEDLSALTSTQLSTFKLPSSPAMVLDAARPGGVNTAFPASPCSLLTWTDLSGNGNHANILGCAGSAGWYGEESVNNPHRFNFDISNFTRAKTNLNVQSSNMPSVTWVVWINPLMTSPGDEQQILSIDSFGGVFNRSILLHMGTSNLGVFQGAGVWQPTSYTANQWQQIAVVFTPSNITLYKNGVAFPYNGAPAFTDTVQTLSIGASNDGANQFYSGSMAWIGVYARALTATEISESCRALKDRFSGVTCN